MTKKWIAVLVVLVSVLAASCSSVDVTTNKVGWSDYTAISAKDFDIVGVIFLESKVERVVSPLFLKREKKGSEITYAMLMQEAVKMKADDIINVRIDSRDESTTSLFDFFTGYNKSTMYYATAMAIRYKDMKDQKLAPEYKQGIGVQKSFDLLDLLP